MKDDRGAPVPVSTVASFGVFARPEFAGPVKAYFALLREYGPISVQPLTLPTVAAADGSAAVDRVAATLRPVLQARFEADGQSSASLRQVGGGDPIAALSRSIAIRLAALGGLPCASYRQLAGLSAPLRLSMPSRVDALQAVWRLARGSSDLPAGIGGDLGPVFDQLCGARVDADRGDRLVDGWCDGAGGCVAVARWVRPDVRDPDLISRSLDATGRTRWIGQMSQGAIVFRGGGDGDELAPTADALWSEVGLIVRTQGGDRYPVLFQFRADPRDGRWVLVRAMRQVSPRMAAGLPAVL